jgi:molybdopterin-guanine dinucleotide biosynthesis protein A
MVAGYVAIVLAGGAARRLGGRDKPALPIGGRPMLDRVLAAASGATCRIVVGPARADVAADVIQVREDPPGGGPVAALAAGLAELDHPGEPGGSDRIGGRAGDLVAVLAADLPFLVSADIEALRDAVSAAGEPTGAMNGSAMRDGPVGGAEADEDAVGRAAAGGGAAGGGALDHGATGGGGVGELDGAVLVDATGRPQWLCGVYRIGALRRRLRELGPPAGQSVRQLVSGLRLATVVRASTPPPWYDCDTEDDYRRAEELA